MTIKFLAGLGVLMIACLPASASGTDFSVATSRPNALSVEILGRGGAYSLNYDHSMSDSVGLGVGFAYYGLNVDGVSASIAVIPVYVDYYFSPDNHRGFLTGGVDVVIISAKIDNWGAFKGSGALGVLGGGYEYRGDGGFLFRVAPYMMVGAGGVAVWGGISFGYAF